MQNKGFQQIVIDAFANITVCVQLYSLLCYYSFMEKQNLSSLIWSTADDVLRGLFKPSEYGRIILPFVVLRRLDCVLEPQKDKAYKLYEKYNKELKDLNKVIVNGDKPV